jgi:SAM-dependent methyltransferase
METRTPETATIPANPNEDLETFVNAALAGRQRLRLLEAGCGAMSHMRVENVEDVTGIDLSPERLARNAYVREKIVGDLQSYPLPPDAFDVIVSWDVLEHLSDPERALENLFRSLKAEGLIVLAFPNILSYKGLLTKLTPYWAHALFYRMVLGDKRKADFDQFPTFLRSFIEPRRLCKFAASHGLPPVYFRLYEGPVQAHLRAVSPVADRLFSLLAVVSGIVTLGRVDLMLSDCLIVLQKTSG